jgi:hypothetical protein
VRLAGDEGIVGEARVGGEVGDDEEIGAADGGGADGRVAGRIASLVGVAVARFLEQPRLVDQVDAGDRALADLGRELGDVVEVLLGLGVQDPVSAQDGDPFGVAFREGDIHGQDLAVARAAPYPAAPLARHPTTRAHRSETLARP